MAENSVTAAPKVEPKVETKEVVGVVKAPVKKAEAEAKEVERTYPRQFRLKSGKHRFFDVAKGHKVLCTPGDLITLSKETHENFKDKFEEVLG